MSDIVKRLRHNAGPSGDWGELADKLQIEAADAIEAKDADIERLRAKLGPLVEEQICVLCGRTEPCMTDEESLAAGGPGAPCTFDPTAQQLWDTNVRLRASERTAWKTVAESTNEIERLQSELDSVRAGNEHLQNRRVSLAVERDGYRSENVRLRAELAAARAECALQPNYSCEHDGCAMQEGSGYQEQAREYVDEYYRMKNELASLKALLREALQWPVPITWAKDVRAALGDEP